LKAEVSHFRRKWRAVAAHLQQPFEGAQIP